MSAFATHSMDVIRMAVGVFIEKRHRSGMKEMLASISSKKVLWNDLERFLEENYRTKRDFAFYGKNNGWVVRFRKAGKRCCQCILEKTHSQYRPFSARLSQRRHLV